MAGLVSVTCNGWDLSLNGWRVGSAAAAGRRKLSSGHDVSRRKREAAGRRQNDEDEGFIHGGLVLIGCL